MVLGEQAKASQLISASDAVTIIIITLKALRRKRIKRGREILLKERNYITPSITPFHPQRPLFQISPCSTVTRHNWCSS